MQNQPETILQFGAGRFLRGFFDRFVHQANLEGQNVGRIVIVQSTPGTRANTLADQNGVYHALYRGVEDGQVVDRPMKSKASAGHWLREKTGLKSSELPPLPN